MTTIPVALIGLALLLAACCSHGALMSTYLTNKMLDKVFKDTAFTTATVYVSLHTATPGTTGASEATGGSYARQAVAAAGWNAAASGANSNVNNIDFTAMPAATITHIGFWDALTSGNYLWGGALSASKTTNSGDTFRLSAAAVTVALS